MCSSDLLRQQVAVLRRQNPGPALDCADQAEVDRLWDALTAEGGAPVACGWVKDRYGLSWQIVPSILPKYLGDPDRAKAQRVMQAMMNMVKLDIADLQRAYEGV